MVIGVGGNGLPESWVMKSSTDISVLCIESEKYSD